VRPDSSLLSCAVTVA